ncbi:phage tail protein, partial [Burkholderia pseudomallei]
VAPDTLHVVIQDDTSDQYSLYAYGLYLENGVLFAVYVQDAPILEKSHAAMILLATDVDIATIDAAKLEFGPATFLN